MASPLRPRRAPPGGGGGELSVGVVTDSAASLPREVAAAAGITVVPMWLTLGDVTVRDGEVDLEEVVARSSDGGFSTAAPSPGEFAAAITDADGGDGVVVVTLAGSMSATHNAATLAASLRDDGTVRVVDSGTAAGAEGLVALAAAAAAARGGDVAAVAAAAAAAAARARLVATLPSLDHLARGGRVPSAAAWAGRALSVNPLFEFRDGTAHPLRPALGRNHAYERIVSLWERDRVEARPGSARPRRTADAGIGAGVGAAAVSPARGVPPAGGDPGRLHLAGMHALDPSGVDRLLTMVGERAAPASRFVGSFSPVMVAHTGPGVVGLAWWWEPGAGGEPEGG